MFESKLNKGKFGGYAPLDLNGKIPSQYVDISGITGAQGPVGFGATGAAGTGSSSVWNASEEPNLPGNFWVVSPQPSPTTASVIFNAVDSNGNNQNEMFTTISGLLSTSIPIVFTITNGSLILSLLITSCVTFDNQWEITGTIIESDVLTGPANYIVSYNVTGPISSPLNFIQRSQIESIPNSSGDGLERTTMVLRPDFYLDNDQYIVLDPTGGVPNHIHIRAGGTIDDSSVDLFIGGEDTNLKVSDTTKSVEINSNNIYVQDSGSFGVGPDYDSATWSGNLITITNPDYSALVNFINGYQAVTDVFVVFYDGGSVALSISNKDISNYPTHVLTVDQTPPTPNLAITGINIQINRYQSGRLIADNGAVTVQAGDTDGPKYWVFGMTGGVGTLRFPDNSVQTTAYPGIPNLINSGNSAPGSAVVANPTNVNINFSDGIGTAWSFGTTSMTFPDDTVQTTAYTGGVGPQGAQGEQGFQGPQGLQGITGSLNFTSPLTMQSQGVSQLYSDTATTSSYTINFNNGNIQRITLNVSISTLTLTNPIAGGVYTLLLVQGTGGAKTVTFTNVLWAGGLAPTLSSTAAQRDMITLIYDGTSYYGLSQNNFA